MGATISRWGLAWAVAAAAFSLAGAAPASAQIDDEECMECGNLVIEQPGEDEWGHRFYRVVTGGMGDDTKFCDSANENEFRLAGSFAVRDHGWCHADAAPGLCGEDHEVCPGSATEIRQLLDDARRLIRRAELAVEDGGTPTEFLSTLAMASFKLSEGRLSLVSCTGDVLGEWQLSEPLVRTASTANGALR